ncbi:hypothetical protein BHE74_00000332 [Ensete ventricosum]|nr:hypothetical protein BHE74_00000332 [Ensete ventricosum]
MKECSGASRATLLLGGVRQQFRGQLVVAWRRASSPFPVSRPYLLLHQTDFPEPLLPSSSPSPDSPSGRIREGGRQDQRHGRGTKTNKPGDPDQEFESQQRKPSKSPRRKAERKLSMVTKHNPILRQACKAGGQEYEIGSRDTKSEHVAGRARFPAGKGFNQINRADKLPSNSPAKQPPSCAARAATLFRPRHR